MKSRQTVTHNTAHSHPPLMIAEMVPQYNDGSSVSQAKLLARAQKNMVAAGVVAHEKQNFITNSFWNCFLTSINHIKFPTNLTVIN